MSAVTTASIPASNLKGRRRVAFLSRSVPFVGTIEKFVTWLLGTVSGLVIVLCVTTGVTITQVADTGSMEPRITGGDFSVSLPATMEDIEVGDIVSFKYRDANLGEIMVIHRVIELHEDGTATTKGDAVPHADPMPLTEDTLEHKTLFLIQDDMRDTFTLFMPTQDWMGAVASSALGDGDWNEVPSRDDTPWGLFGILLVFFFCTFMNALHGIVKWTLPGSTFRTRVARLFRKTTNAGSQSAPLT